MRISVLALRMWAAQLLVFVLFSSSSYAYSSSQANYPVFGEEASLVVAEAVSSPGSFNYERFEDVKEACKSILSAASKLKLDGNAAYSIQNELSFYRGDWNQSSNDGRPLMQFDKTSANNSYRLASFSLMDVDIRRQQSPVAVNVSGSLFLTISPTVGGYRRGNYSFAYPDGASSSGYTSASLEISMEGVYTESDVNGGLQRVMCLLGKTTSFSSSHHSRSNWGLPSSLRDEKFLLILRYPKALTLTTRAIHGELTSLRQQTDHNYFDKIMLTSQLGPYAKYQFEAADNLLSKACTPYPYQDRTLATDKLHVYKGGDLCRLLGRFAQGPFIVVPNWKCDSTDQYCRKLGPFHSDQEVNKTDGGFQKVGLLMQDVRCEPIPRSSGGNAARVSAYYRAAPSSSLYDAQQRTGLDGTTLAVQGKWDSASGQLCMVGCIGSSGENCNSRVCLYFSFSFSISQRNIIVGSISPINDEKNPFFPLSFEKPVSPVEFRYFNLHGRFSYEYTKFKQAVAFLEKSEAFDFGAVIKKAVLKYPRKQEGYGEDQGLYILAEDLTLETVVIPDPLPNSHTERTFFRLGIFTIGSFVRDGWWMSNETIDHRLTKSVSTEGQLLLNVSATLELRGESYRNVSVLSLEGLYDPLHGRLFLIACRDVRASWKILSESRDLENGLDCLIAVKIEYPPINVRWLVNQIAKISIESQRTEDDPLYFSPIKLQTHPLLFRNQEEDLLFRELVEGILQISTFSIAIGCITSQLFYSGKESDSVPYISLVMLGVQTVGYSIPLITGAEALFSARKYGSYRTFDGLGKNMSSQLIGYFFKMLVLVAFLLTLRLAQKVWKSRTKLVRQTPLYQGQVPDDKLVFLTCLAVHSVGFLAVLAMHITSSSLKSQNADSKGIREWHVELEEYAGLVQDFFLLPQVIGNFIWHTNCKPLRKTYYITITFLRILPHIYDYVTTPAYNPYVRTEFEYANPTMDFYSIFDDIAIPVIAVLLSAIIYLQQQRTRPKLFESFRLRHLNIFSTRSRTYQKVPTVSEAELVSVNVPKD